MQETRDKELILLHDDSLKRTAGVSKKVWEMDLAQIEKLDAGVSFHQKFRGEHIPTLPETLKFCKGRLDLNIEIKYNGKNRGIVYRVVPVSYTHLDVYKRQVRWLLVFRSAFSPVLAEQARQGC